MDAPEDQAVFIGEHATFEVEPRVGDLKFQWVRQWHDHDEILAGQTASSLTISNAQISDVGRYLCAVSQGEQIQLTRSASLNVWVYSSLSTSGKSDTRTQTQSLTTLSASSGTVRVFAAPVLAGGNSGSCPGAYAGYVSYTKTVSQGWGWAPTAGTALHTATDDNRTDTKVQYLGKSGDLGCNQTSVPVPHPTASLKYRFTIYFPNNVPTNAYAITLSGFDP